MPIYQQPGDENHVPLSRQKPEKRLPIAGPNRASKTTFAYEFAPREPLPKVRGRRPDYCRSQPFPAAVTSSGFRRSTATSLEQSLAGSECCPYRLRPSPVALTTSPRGASCVAMKHGVEALIISATGASRCGETEVLQSLWSGYGSILRYELEGVNRRSVIVKHVSPPPTTQHPRGWSTDRSHARKLKSYQVETAWYQHYAERCGARCRVPECLGVETEGDEVLLLLEDLDASGYGERRRSVNEAEMKACLTWLANFHANFLGSSADALWECGTYWHLATRPDELSKLSTADPALWRGASAIDAKLQRSPFQTLVHGDAKLANFCFAADRAAVAGVDFQYVGRGCGMKDVAYFIGSCCDESACERQTPAGVQRGRGSTGSGCYLLIRHRGSTGSGCYLLIRHGPSGEINPQRTSGSHLQSIRKPVRICGQLVLQNLSDR